MGLLDFTSQAFGGQSADMLNESQKKDALAMTLLNIASNINPYGQNVIGDVARGVAGGRQIFSNAAQQSDLQSLGGDYGKIAEYWAQRGDPEKAAQYMQLANISGGMNRAFAKVENIINPETGKPDVAIIDEYGNPKFVGLDMSTATPAKSKLPTPPSGYMWNEEGTGVQLIPGYTPKPEKPQKTASVEDLMKLSSKFESAIKDDAAAAASFKSMRANAALGTPQGDIALIFGYMKTLDPTSVVREGEFATAQNAGGIDEKTRAQINQLLGTGRLTPEQRTKLLESAQAVMQGRYESSRKTINKYTGFANKYGVDAADFIIDPFDGIDMSGKPAQAQQKKADFIWRNGKLVKAGG